MVPLFGGVEFVLRIMCNTLDTQYSGHTKMGKAREFALRIMCYSLDKQYSGHTKMENAVEFDLRIMCNLIDRIKFKAF